MNEAGARKGIVQTFSKLIEHRSFSEINVTDIVRATPCNRSTFYDYFTDKYALRRYIIDQAMDSLRSKVALDYLSLDYHDTEHFQEPFAFMEDFLKQYSFLTTPNAEIDFFSCMQSVFEEKALTWAKQHKGNYPAEFYAMQYAGIAIATVRWAYLNNCWDANNMARHVAASMDRGFHRYYLDNV